MIVTPYSWGIVREKQLAEHGITEGVSLDLTTEKLDDLLKHFSIMLKADKKTILMFIDSFGSRFSVR